MGLTSSFRQPGSEEDLKNADVCFKDIICNKICPKSTSVIIKNVTHETSQSKVNFVGNIPRHEGEYSRGLIG